MTQRAWLITGVSSGFGRHMTEQLLARGDRVAGTARTVDAAADLKAKYGDRFWLGQLDLTDTAAIKQVVQEAFADLGKIDVVVSNAGYGLFGSSEGLTDEQIDHQIRTNTIGPIHLVRAVVPHLRAQGGGRLLQISTYGGQVAQAGASLYHASKWGAEAFFESMMAELAPFNIGVTIVEPGGARTAFRTGSAKVGRELEAYKGTPAGMVHGFLRNPPPAKGDPARMVEHMIESVEREPAPKRLVLGGDAYVALLRGLEDRLADIQTQKDTAFSTDVVVES